MTGRVISKDKTGDNQPRGGKEQVRDDLDKLVVFTLVGLDEIHPSKLKEWAEEIAELLAITLRPYGGQHGPGKVEMDKSECQVFVHLKKKSYRLACLTSVPRKIPEHIIKSSNNLVLSTWKVAR